MTSIPGYKCNIFSIYKANGFYIINNCERHHRLVKKILIMGSEIYFISENILIIISNFVCYYICDEVISFKLSGKSQCFFIDNTVIVQDEVHAFIPKSKVIFDRPKYMTAGCINVMKITKDSFIGKSLGITQVLLSGFPAEITYSSEPDNRWDLWESWYKNINFGTKGITICKNSSHTKLMRNDYKKFMMDVDKLIKYKKMEYVLLDN